MPTLPSYESFTTRADVEQQGSTQLDLEGSLTPKERFKSAVQKCITLNTLKAILEEQSLDNGVPPEQPQEQPTEHPRNAGKYTVVAFVNSASGGGVGKLIHNELVQHLGQDYVFDLKSCRKGNMPEDELLKYSNDPHVRILACGGDGTCGWIESSMDKVWRKVFGKGTAIENVKYNQYLPLAIMPLGTGNDLSRQFGWGGKFQVKMRSEAMIKKVEQAQPAGLDRWKCIILPIKRLDDECRAWLPKMLGDEKTVNTEDQVNNSIMLEELFHEESSEDSLHESMQLSRFIDGVFCNYFSIGFDAAIAFAFHKEREEHPERFTSLMMNKML